MRTYRAITKMLKEDPELSLKLYFIDMSYGVKNFRTASIYEPNPYEGKVANPESGLDQQVLEGPRRKRFDHSFKAKHTIQALDLLERTCSGKKGLKDKVQESRGNKYFASRNYRPHIHGYGFPKSGLDTWIFNDFMFEIQQEKEGKMILNATSGEFYVHGTKVSSIPIASVGEAVAFYQDHPVNNSVLRNLQKGILLKEGISKYAGLEIDENFLKNAEGIFAQEFLDEYDFALESLTPFNIPKKVQTRIFLAMLFDKFHSKKN